MHGYSPVLICAPSACLASAHKQNIRSLNIKPMTTTDPDSSESRCMSNNQYFPHSSFLHSSTALLKYCIILEKLKNIAIFQTPYRCLLYTPGQPDVLLTLCGHLAWPD